MYSPEFLDVLNMEMKAIFKELKNAQRIVIFRHEVPDFDALGTQMGLYYWIKSNWPTKDVHFVGEGYHSFTPRIFPNPEVLPESWYQEPYLAVVVDTPTKDRISLARFDKVYKIVRFDHHPMVEEWGDLTCIHPEMAACAEVVALMLEAFGKKGSMPKDAARAFYIGIVGDTGRFRFPECSSSTLRLAADLLDTGIVKEDIYQEMYLETQDEFNFTKWVLDNYHITAKGTAYYVLRKADLDKLHLVTGDGKLGLDEFRDLDGVTSAVSITEDSEKNNFRLSFRSEHKAVAQVAAMYHGGGHEFAAGGKLDSIDQVAQLIKDLDDLPCKR